MRFLVTGTAGFIGFHVAKRLISDGHFVVGYDGMTQYYDVKLKQARHAQLEATNGFRPHIGMLEDVGGLSKAVDDGQPEVIIHLAAQAGVRYSLENPRSYLSSNIEGTFNILELARTTRVKHLLLASTSSVYGGNLKVPAEEIDRTDSPSSLYAATKKATEAMSHSYAHLWHVPTTVFRFFTVYGPWGRPDMALFRFVDAIENNRPIDVYGYGEMRRDFTYIDDLVEGIVRLVGCVPETGAEVAVDGGQDSLSPTAPWRSVNIGGGNPVGLLSFIEAIEKVLGRPAQRNLLPMQKGDVLETFASPALLEALTGYRPTTGVDEGVAAFVNWYKTYNTAK